MTTPAFEDYQAWQNRWKEHWEALNALSRFSRGWETPWLDESWLDGNPIFSALSARHRHGVRVLQHEDMGEPKASIREFGTGEDTIRELVLACAVDERDLDWAFALISEWVETGAIQLARFENIPSIAA